MPPATGFDAGRRQLKREGESVQPHTQRGDGRRRDVGHLEVGFDRPCPLDEERDRSSVDELRQRGEVLQVRQRQRCHRILLLATQLEPGAAGHQHLQAGRRLEQVGDEGRGAHDLLEVVQQNQQAPVAQIGHQRLQQRLLPAFLEAKRLRKRRDDQFRVADGRQVDEADAVREVVAQLGCRLQREARLARAAGSRQRQQPHLRALEQRDCRGHLPGAPDERGSGDGEGGGDYDPGRCNGQSRRRCARTLIPGALSRREGLPCPRRLHEGVTLRGRDLQRLGELRGHRPRRPQPIRLEFVDRHRGAAHHLRQLGLGQVQCFAALFEPGAKRGGAAHACLHQASSLGAVDAHVLC